MGSLNLCTTETLIVATPLSEDIAPVVSCGHSEDEILVIKTYRQEHNYAIDVDHSFHIS